MSAEGLAIIAAAASPLGFWLGVIAHRHWSRRAQARAFADRANAMTAGWSADDVEWARLWAVIGGQA